MTHGDDIMAVGDAPQAQWLDRELRKVYEIKSEIVDGSKDGEILNRRIRKTARVWELEADNRHAKIAVEIGSAWLGTKGTGRTPLGSTRLKGDQRDASAIDDNEASLYRAVIGRCNYLASDRPDIAYSCTDLARAMSGPKREDVREAGRLLQYLRREPRLVQQFC